MLLYLRFSGKAFIQSLLRMLNEKAENKWSLWHDNNDLENIQDCVKVLEGSKKVKTVDM